MKHRCPHSNVGEVDGDILKGKRYPCRGERADSEVARYRGEVRRTEERARNKRAENGMGWDMRTVEHCGAADNTTGGFEASRWATSGT